jgi:hypothetical protein
MDEAYQLLHNRLSGLSDEEFFWEPVPGCWTVHQDEQGCWVEDYEQPEPEPAPFTTIGWRLVHVALCKIMYHEYAFGPRKLTWDNIEIPHSAASTLAVLEKGQALLKESLLQLQDADLDQMVLTNWGEQWPIQRIYWVIILHDLHHGGEIGCVRDLYRVMHPSNPR